jgi:hypothetical protein
MPRELCARIGARGDSAAVSFCEEGEGARSRELAHRASAFGRH